MTTTAHPPVHAAATPTRAGTRRRRPRGTWLTTALVFDAVAILVSTVAALNGREAGWLVGETATMAAHLELVAPLLVVGWLVVIAVLGGYRSEIRGAGTDEYSRVARASIYTGGLFGLACYLVDYDLSRGFFVLLFGLGLPALLLERLLLRKAMQRIRRRGYAARRVVVCGDAAHVDDIAHVLQRDRWLGYQVVGAVLPAGADLLDETPAGVPVLATDGAVAATAVAQDAEVAFFAGGSTTSAEEMRRATWDLERAGVEVVLAPSLTDTAASRLRIRPVGGMPLVHVAPPTWADASRWGKRTFDVVGSSLLLLALSPLLLLTALAIKLDDGGPVLFKQTRVGRHGRAFACWKLRSMVVDAEERLAVLKDEVDFDGVLFKLERDPRITRVGRWLRRLSVDELPQLVNVLRGQMSLVGPRPPLPSEVEGYDAGAARRLWVRPGMTGLWQVSGRSRLTWDEAIRLDLYYVDNWSMVQDLSILVKTVGAVLSGRGAY